jgi:hypothetical protein
MNNALLPERVKGEERKKHKKNKYKKGERTVNMT